MRFFTLAASFVAVATTAVVASPTPTWGPWGESSPWAPLRNDYSYRLETIETDCPPDACETRGYYYGDQDRYGNNSPCRNYQDACYSLGDVGGPSRTESFCREYPDLWAFDAHCTVINTVSGEALSYTGIIAERQYPGLVEVYRSDGNCYEINRGLCEVRNPDNSVARFRRDFEKK